MYQESWIKDAVFCLFTDTRDCSPSLANFFRGPKQSGSKLRIGIMRTSPSMSVRPPSLGLSPETSGEQLHANPTKHLGEAVKKLAPLGKTIDTTSAQSVQLHHRKNWERWIPTGEMVGATMNTILVGCLMLGAFKVLSMRCGYSGISHKWRPGRPNLHTESLAWTMNPLLELFRQKSKHRTDKVTLHSTWPSVDTIRHKRQMPLELAESLVKQWQDIKAEALGPDHRIETLSEILAESMLSKWKDLANSAKASSCFWRFVLLQLSVSRADILLDEAGNKVAEVEAVLEEAAELIDESMPKKANYYSTYKVQYILKRGDDGSWRFCGGGVETPI